MRWPVVLFPLLLSSSLGAEELLPGTVALKAEGDLSMRVIEQLDRFLLERIERSKGERKAGTREEFAEMLGMRDALAEKPRFTYHFDSPDQRRESKGVTAYDVSWPAFADVTGRGILLVPEGKVMADVVLIPDPEDNLEAFIETEGMSMARSACSVLIPTIINREDHSSKMTNREWVHRPAWELGRTLTGYEVAKVLTGVDALRSRGRPVGIAGRGEGGRLALYAGALDNDVAAVWVSGYLGPREAVWNEVVDRNLFGQLNAFGDAEIASLVGESKLVVEADRYPTFVFRPDANGEPESITERAKNGNGKPGKLLTFSKEEVIGEYEEAFSDRQSARLAFLKKLGTSPPGGEVVGDFELPGHHDEQLRELERHNTWSLEDAARVRAELFSQVDTRSLEGFEKTIEPLRELFRTEVIGDFEESLVDPNPRSRVFSQSEKTTSYEVVLDVWEGVTGYGILTLPNDLAPGKYPVVVCQHGLEGRPLHLLGEEKFKAYKAFATGLAERGYITFAPQNPYLGFDKFRTLQFKANALGATLFSLAVPQHEQFVKWLGALPFVDADRIGFYGLSYGGKSAMRIPPLVEGYTLSICSGDFNDWIWKNAATDPVSLRYSYANKGEYEIFEWNLGNTFNYAEMAALIAPRPFMVERGHFDGVAPDDRVAAEFAKIRRLYGPQLGIGERAEIEWFAGPHTINGVGTFNFLDQHLKKGKN